MVKLLIVTHGPFAEGIKESARMFFGDSVNKIATIGLFPTDSPESLQDKIVDEIIAHDEGDGYMVFVDVFGGSPFNMSALAIEDLKDQHQIQCFAGINMPLLVEALSSVEEGMKLDELVTHLEEVASTTIINIRKTLEI